MDSVRGAPSCVLHGGVAGKEDTPRGTPYQFCDIGRKQAHMNWSIRRGTCFALFWLGALRITWKEN